MLVSLQIENFALVDRIELEFGAGLNVLTGETGAGKSIILDALDAALGGKVNSRAVRTGAERALIEATFQLTPALVEWLTEQEIELIDDTSLICVRDLTLSGSGIRSRSRINGIVVNKQQMDDLRDRLVEITAQGQTVQMGKPSIQREWLDGFGGAAILAQREIVATAYMAFQQAAQALERRRKLESERLQQIDMFEYQAKELSAANLVDPEELIQLENERQRLSHSVELQQQSYQVYQLLYQNDAGSACSDLLGQAQSTLHDMERFDTEIQPILEMVNTALSQVEEAGRLINSYGEGLETDPQRLEDVQERIVQLKQICRKYGPTLADAIERSQTLQAQLAELSDAGQSIEALEETHTARKADLRRECDRLTELRQSAARELESRLLAELKPLAMDKVQFRVDLSPVTPTASGADRIVYLFSPNPGEPMQPLTEIASGGEMSRFLLALKACFSQIDMVGSMVFDEIDVGVSGRVAQAIAEKLHQLSQRHQVLCVTHQPIVAAMADTHYRVSKMIVDPSNGKNGHSRSKGNGAKIIPDSMEDVRTVVRVAGLTAPQRLEELAQLAIGKSDQDAIAFAESLMAQAASARQQYAAPTSTTVKSKTAARKKGG